MRKRIDLACPKCGATTNLFLYTSEWRSNRIHGIDPKSGALDAEDLDFTNTSYVRTALARCNITLTPDFVAHEPDERLTEACHVWIHDPAPFVTDRVRLSMALQRALRLSEARADEIVDKHYRDGDSNALNDIIDRHCANKNAEHQIDRTAAELSHLIGIDIAPAKELVNEYLAAHPLESPSLRVRVDPEAVLRWALTSKGQK